MMNLGLFILGLHRGNINLEFDIESEYKSRLKLIDSNNISKRIGFVPLWMIKGNFRIILFPRLMHLSV